MRVVIDASTNEEVRKAVQSIALYDGKSRIAVENAINKSVKRMAGNAKKRVPVRRGALKASIFSSFTKQPLQGCFGAKKPHAHLMEYGVRATLVVSKKKKPLRFFPAGTMGAVYSRSARIPARKARPFIMPAYEEGKPCLFDMLKKALQGGAK